MLKFLLFLLLVFPKQSFIMACSYTNTTACNLQGKCTKSGTCLCDLFYYGDDCELVVEQNKRVKIVQTGITQGDLAGIIIGWMFGIFILIGIPVFLIIYRKRKMEIEFLKNLPVPTYQPKPLSENDNPIDIPIISPFNETKNEFPFKTDYLKNKNVTTAIIDIRKKPNLEGNLYSASRANLSNEQTVNNHLAIELEKNLKENTPFSDEMIFKSKDINTFKITPMIQNGYASFLAIMDEYPICLKDAATYIEGKINQESQINHDDETTNFLNN